MSKFNSILKRIFDFFASLLGIIVLSPILVAVSIAIKLDSKGNILFLQKRVGKDGVPFNIYKFRTMVTDAEKLGKQITVGKDSRITKTGAFLRKYKIDELPQLFNVLKGDMSLVGPRPAILREVAQYNEYQMQRLVVKPGITCIWQVSGRNNIGFEEWVELDLEYIRKQSFMLDLILIFKTIPALLGDKNAS